MLHLFSADLLYNGLKQSFSVYQLADNLYQAKSSLEVVVLWKKDNNWEGTGNIEETSLIELIGSAIDKHFSTTNSYKSF